VSNLKGEGTTSLAKDRLWLASQRLVSDLEDAELLVYLVDEEMDIYIGVHRTPPRTCPAEHSPAESLSYLGVAESIRIYATATAPPHY
jgi:hypothetical protein